MGYFPNGTEGELYHAAYCAKCIHRNGHDGKGYCAVMAAHILHNYNECNNPDSILNELIPREGIENGRCRMFVESARVYVGTFPEHLRQWADRNRILDVKPSAGVAEAKPPTP